MRLGVWYCGNIVVATFLCLNISLLSAAGAPVNIADLDIHKARQQAYKSFHGKYGVKRSNFGL